MKSIANQYRDLKEGKMTQQNFMRNLRMSMPQFITNVTSFGDAVKILKNKSIITEAPTFKSKPEETPIIKSGDTIELDGMLRDLYGKPFLGGYFLDYTKVPHELVLQISKEPAQDGQKTSDIEKLGTAVLFKDSEWSLNGMKASTEDQEMLDKIKAVAFPTQNEMNEPKEKETGDEELDTILQGVEDEKAGEEAVKAQYDEKLNEAKKKEEKEYHRHQVNPTELRLGIKTELEHGDMELDKAKEIAYKNIAKDPIYYTTLKLSGIEAHPKKVKGEKETPVKKAKKESAQLVDLINGMQKVKMPKADEKKKIKESVDEKMYFADMPADPEKYKMVRDSKGYIIKATNADGVEFQKGDTVKTYDGEEIKIAKFEESQGKVKAIYNKGMFFASIDIDGLEAPKPTMRPGVDMGASFEKMKRSLEEIVRETISEYFDGRDNLIDPLAGEEEAMNEGYYDDIAGYTSVSDNGTGFKDNDKVKSKSGQEGFVYDVLKSKDGKALVVVKWQKNGNTVIAKYGEGFSDINDISK